MSNAIINEDHLVAIADAIRTKLGISDSYRPDQMAGAILSIGADPGHRFSAVASRRDVPVGSATAKYSAATQSYNVDAV